MNLRAVDHLDLVWGNGQKRSWEEIESIIKDLRDIAIKHNITVVMKSEVKDPTAHADHIIALNKMEYPSKTTFTLFKNRGKK